MKAVLAVRSPNVVMPSTAGIAAIYAMLILQVKDPNITWLVSTVLFAATGFLFGYGCARPAQRPWHMMLGGFMIIVTAFFHVVRVTLPMLAKYHMLP